MYVPVEIMGRKKSPNHRHNHQFFSTRTAYPCQQVEKTMKRALGKRKKRYKELIEMRGKKFIEKEFQLSIPIVQVQYEITRY